MAKVTVIGAGPAGSVAALVLARAGAEVTVIEQHRFPRDKVCGECLSALAIETLEALGIARGVSELGPAVLRETWIHTTGGATYRLGLPRVMWGISRRALDDFLLKQAASAGAEVLQPARCEGVEPGGSVRLRDLSDNTVRAIDGDWVIAAEGKSVRALSAAAVTSDFGIKAHFADVDGPDDAIELFGVRGAYGGLAPIEDERWNAAFSVPGKRLRECGGDIEGLFGELREENPVLHRRLRGARRVSEWLAAPLPRFWVRKCWPDRVIPVGNAAAAIEPIGGEGMGLAVASAVLAARFIIGQGARSAGGGCSQLLREYEKLWRVRRPSCRLAAMIISRPWAARMLLPLLDVIPLARDVSLSLLGKGYLKPSMSDIV